MTAIFIVARGPLANGVNGQDATDDVADVAVESGSRQLFSVLGIDQPRLQLLTDGTDLESTEQETWVRILLRLNRFGDEAIRRWRHDVVPWQAIEEAPDLHRLEIFRLAGRVVDVRAYPFPAELARRFELPQVYQLKLQVNSLEQPVTLFSVSVPRRWEEHLSASHPAASKNSDTGQDSSAGSYSWNENVRLSAWFVKLGSPVLGQPAFLFVTPRIQWFPDRLNSDLGITADQVALARQGVDLSRLDEVRDESELGVQDREAFYQLLAATAPENSLSDPLSRPDAADATSLLQKLFANPKPQRGNRFTFHGIARRAVKIQVDDPDIRRRYGIDHYFELELFVALDQSVRVLISKDDQTGKLFHAYPIAYCTRQLPPGMPAGEIIQEEVEVTGHFFKLWAYATQYMNEPSSEEPPPETDTPVGGRRRRKQVSPLLIGPQPNWYSSERIAPSVWDWRWTAAAVGGMGVIYWVLWRLTRGERQQRQLARRSRFQLPPNPSLDDLPELGEGPDFSGLD